MALKYYVVYCILYVNPQTHSIRTSDSNALKLDYQHMEPLTQKWRNIRSLKTLKDDDDHIVSVLNVMLIAKCFN